ncbi:unnamed protein product [Blumeria hordei]|uniref:Uncharacterized protein n=1 Tax=Blumeria hordei TaxID=2867405 RepID=A0A383UPR5_BLUHO|nr:unnamed protein product [Blumeria hordei]
MKTFQFASIVAGLGFLKPIAADDYFSCGFAQISVENVDRVAGNLWSHELGAFQSSFDGRFPVSLGESEYGELRKFPLLYNGKDWEFGSFMYHVISNREGSYVKLFYEGTKGLEECVIVIPE